MQRWDARTPGARETWRNSRRWHVKWAESELCHPFDPADSYKGKGLGGGSGLPAPDDAELALLKGSVGVRQTRWLHHFRLSESSTDTGEIANTVFIHVLCPLFLLFVVVLTLLVWLPNGISRRPHPRRSRNRMASWRLELRGVQSVRSCIARPRLWHWRVSHGRA